MSADPKDEGSLNPVSPPHPLTPSLRLVTLTGPGGTGKTRLSQQAAQELCDVYPGGVWFVSLRELGDPALIPEQILLALRLPRNPQREALEQVVGFLSQAPSLLLLDNYEHLVERGAEIVQRLLEQVRELTVLVTSRQSLGLEGEREFSVAPLPVPGLTAHGEGPLSREPCGYPRNGWMSREPEALLQCPSVQLFVDRAQAVCPDFQVTARNAAAVAALCQRLEGLPLAIELAAARSGVLTPQQILSRLRVPAERAMRFELLVGRQRTADPRHRSLRATLDWSYQLLSPELQRFFDRLSVFRGGWTVEAAAAVCSDFGFRVPDTHFVGTRRLDFGLGPTKTSDGPESSTAPDRTNMPGSPEPLTLAAIQNPESKIQNALECLQQLRECSLAQATEAGGQMRFHLLETLREYGAEQLAAEDRTELARQHAHFFLALAETAEPELTRADQVLWLDRLEREQDNLRAALGWSLESGESEWGLRLCSALEQFWHTRGYVKEGRAHLMRLLAEPGAAPLSAVRARALSTAGWLTALQGDLDAVPVLYEESLALWRRLGDRVGIARVLLRQGWYADQRLDHATARARAEESLAIQRELGEPRGLAAAVELTARVRGEDGDPKARGLLEESIAIWQALGDRVSATRGLASLADWALCEGDLDTARRLHEEVLSAATELGDRPRVGWALFGLGEVAQVQEDYATACTYYERSLPLWQELDEKRGSIQTRCYLGFALMRQGDPAAAYARFAEVLPIAREGNRHGPVAEALAFMGWAASALGRWEETAVRSVESLRLCGAGDSRKFHIAIEYSLFGLAQVALVRGNPVRAARLLGATEAVWGDVGDITPARRRELDQVAAAIRAQTDPAEFEAAWAEGQAMPLAQMIALALQEAPVS